MNNINKNLSPWLSINKVSFKKDLLSHGYLLSGENGIGKRDFANELSKSILCTESDQLFEACGKCNSCKLFAGKSSPDYHFIEEEVGSNIIKIGQLRGNKQKKDSFEGIVDKIYETPLVSSSKVFIINNAHLMNDESQNFLLKILEEPPLKTFIFLLSSSPFLLKKTLLSRLSHIHFKFPKYIELKDYYESKGFNFRESDFDLVKGLNLTKLTEKNLNEARENWAEFMNDLSELSSYKEIEKVVSKWDNELIQEKLIWLSRILINSFGSKLKIKSSSVRFKVDSFEMKSLIELSEIFKTIQEILIDLNSGVKLNNKVQLKSLLMSLN